MGKSLKNDDDASDTFADPVVRVEALSTVGQTVALAQGLGVDAGCTVRGRGSWAAGTRVVTNWGREEEGNTMGPRWLGCLLLGQAPYVLGSPLIYHSIPLQLLHKIKRYMCSKVVIAPELPTLPLYPSFTMFYQLFISYPLCMFVLSVLYILPLLTFIATLWGRYY